MDENDIRAILGLPKIEPLPEPPDVRKMTDAALEAEYATYKLPHVGWIPRRHELMMEIGHRAQMKRNSEDVQGIGDRYYD